MRLSPSVQKLDIGCAFSVAAENEVEHTDGDFGVYDGFAARAEAARAEAAEAELAESGCAIPMEVGASEDRTSTTLETGQPTPGEALPTRQQASATVASLPIPEEVTVRDPTWMRVSLPAHLRPEPASSRSESLPIEKGPTEGTPIEEIASESLPSDTASEETLNETADEFPPSVPVTEQAPRRSITYVEAAAPKRSNRGRSASELALDGMQSGPDWDLMPVEAVGSGDSTLGVGDRMLIRRETLAGYDA